MENNVSSKRKNSDQKNDSNYKKIKISESKAITSTSSSDEKLETSLSTFDDIITFINRYLFYLFF